MATSFDYPPQAEKCGAIVPYFAQASRAGKGCVSFSTLGSLRKAIKIRSSSCCASFILLLSGENELNLCCISEMRESAAGCRCMVGQYGPVWYDETAGLDRQTPLAGATEKSLEKRGGGGLGTYVFPFSLA
jgi:hypothetical protein